MLGQSGDVVVPASDGQRLLWFADHYRKASDPLLIPTAVRVDRSITALQVDAAVNWLTERHGALRTTYERRGRKLVQIVKNTPSPDPLEVQDMTGFDDPELATREGIVGEFHRALDTARWPTRTVLFRLDADRSVVVLATHHLATDGRSNVLLSRDLRAMLTTAMHGEPSGLPDVGWHYHDFSEWQRKRLEGAVGERHRRFWAKHLADASPLDIPMEKGGRGGPRPPVKHVAVVRSPEMTTAVVSAAAEAKTTPFALLLAAFYAALHWTTGQDDLVVATMMANRGHRAVQETVGFFSNLVILRAKISRGGTFRDLLVASRSSHLNALAHQELPHHVLTYEEFGKRLRFDDVAFHIVPTQPGPGPGPDAELTPLVVETRSAARFGLEFSVIPSDDEFRSVVTYSPDRFERAWVEALADRFVQGVDVMLTAPERRLSAGPLGSSD